MTTEDLGLPRMPVQGMPVQRQSSPSVVGQLVLALGCVLFAAAVLSWFVTRGDTHTDFLASLWDEPPVTLESYHYVAVDQAGGVWEVWFQAPNRWLLRSPFGVQFSDGQNLIDYDASTNSYSRSGTPGRVEAGPLGPRSAEVLKRVQSESVISSTSSSLRQATFQGIPVDVLQTRRKVMIRSLGFELTREITVDPRYLFLLSETLTDSAGGKTQVDATSVEYNPALPADAISFELPPGACLKPRPSAC